MRNADRWVPSKFVYEGGRLQGSRDPRALGIGSRLSADLVAGCYDRHLGHHARGRLLDLGCGKAPLYQAYRGHVDECICADWAKSLHESPYLDLICDLSKMLPFRDASFDTVVLSSVLEHVPEPALLWAEISRVLRPGGKLILNSPFYYRIHEAPHDYYRYTEYALRRFSADAGFRVVVFEATGGAPEVLADTFAKLVVHVPWVGRHVAAISQWLAGKLLLTPWGRRLSVRTSIDFPLSYFAVAMKS